LKVVESGKCFKVPLTEYIDALNVEEKLKALMVFL
jgi:hypothetical protein